MKIRGWLVAAMCATGCAGAPARPVPVDAPMPPLDAMASIGEDFGVATVEPAWRVRVQDKELVLAGPGVRRRLPVASNEVLFDGRQVVARDALGQVEVRVTPRACQDPATGAWHALTARVTVDAMPPVLGCGDSL